MIVIFTECSQLHVHHMVAEIGHEYVQLAQCAHTIFDERGEKLTVMIITAQD